jgi:uncharacterized protein (TIGR02757 family)
MTENSLKDFLDEKAARYNQPEFIDPDPIAIPHEYSKLQDIEITGFWAAMLAWGQRKTILNKSRELFALMDNSPHEFIMNHREADLKPFLKFRHRTFNPDDTLYFISFFRHFYRENDTLEKAFVKEMHQGDTTVEQGINGFHSLFFSLPEAPARTRKHVATPARNSACKRINMFLRWMVRKDDHGVDFGLWRSISPDQLVCPCDVHVDRVARRLGLIDRKQTDWKTALELTEKLREFDPQDPVKYDFALFGLGLEDRWG